MRLRTIVLVFLLPLAVVSAACYAGYYHPGPPPVRPWGPGPAAGPEVEIGFFYSELVPYGDWILLESYGWVWMPWEVPAGWRPYTYGRWVYTIDGWTWISDWGWGWAPFHYGRWSWHQHYGWVWAPGTVWAPAWVAWRTGPGWVGWAPLPPGVGWRIGVGLDFGDVDLSIAIGTHWWVFVEDRDFLDHRPWHRAALVPRNAYLFGLTRDATRYRDVDRRVFVPGVPVERIERAVGRAVPRYRVEDLERPPSGRFDPFDRDRVRVYRPDPRGGAARTRPSEPGRDAGQAPPGAAAARVEAVERSQEKDLRQLESWERTQRERLDAVHRREVKKPPEGTSADEVRRRQKAEKQALEKQIERQKTAIDTRHDQQKKAVEERQKAVEKEKAKRRKPPG